MKQKNAVTAIPGAIWGSRNCQIKRGRVYPSRNAVSSISLGMAEMKPCRIQIEMGKIEQAMGQRDPKDRIHDPKRRKQLKDREGQNHRRRDPKGDEGQKQVFVA